MHVAIPSVVTLPIPCAFHTFTTVMMTVNCTHDLKCKAEGVTCLQTPDGHSSAITASSGCNDAEKDWQREFGSRHVTKFGQKVKLKCVDYNIVSYFLTLRTVQV